MDPNKLPDSTLLKAVSRSFYTSLSVLPATLRPLMSLGYLLCRTADTLADTAILPSDKRMAFLTKFRQLFESFPPHVEMAKNLGEELSTQISLTNSAEAQLVKNFSTIYSLLPLFSLTDQALINDVVRSVIDGMLLDLTEFSSNKGSLTALNTTADLDRYLTLIGGEPGRFWTRACLEHIPHLNIVDRANWIYLGINLGKGLQLVNILRDIPQDLKNGRCYIPHELLASHGLQAHSLTNLNELPAFLPLFHELIDKALSYLEYGLSYMKKLPITELRLRVAVWLPMILGVRTLASLRIHEDILNPNVVIKINRKEVLFELSTAWVKTLSDQLLRIDFNSWKKKARSQSD